MIRVLIAPIYPNGLAQAVRKFPAVNVDFQVPPSGAWGIGRIPAGLRSLALLIASVSFALLLGEAAVRLFMPQYLRPVFRERVGGYFFLRANLHTRIYSPGEFDTRVTTSSQRFRGTTLYDSVPATGTFRIATIGDSFTFGTGTQDDQTFPERLRKNLVRSGRFHRVEVLNGGIPNAGPGDEALWYDRWVRRFHPDLVILSIYGGNDISDELHDSKFVLNQDGQAAPLDSVALAKQTGFEAWLQQRVLRIPGYDFLTTHSELLYAVRSTLTGLLSSQEREQLRSPAADSSARAVIEKIAAETRWLHQRVRASGARLIVVFIPSRDKLAGSPSHQAEVVLADALDRRLAQESAQDSIPFLDLGRIIPARVGSRGAELYFTRDDHMRPVGYQLVGDEVARLVVSDLPAPKGIQR